MANNMLDTAPSLKCQICHADQEPGMVGPCHRCIPGEPHTPHGTNIFMITEQIHTPNRGTHSVVLSNGMGLADGSLASVTQPGTGLCETCHTCTEFYRSDGTGAVHFPYTCFACHPHAIGFTPS